VKVRTAARQSGVGAALLDAARAKTQQRGCLRLILLNGREPNAYRNRFHQSAGWQERTSMADSVHHLEAVAGSQPPVDEESVP